MAQIQISKCMALNLKQILKSLDFVSRVLLKFCLEKGSPEVKAHYIKLNIKFLMFTGI